jgi:hypothetical protein
MSSSCRKARFLLLGVLIVLEGCMFFTLREELTEMKQMHALTGKILNQTQPESNVVIVLYEQTPDGLKLLQSTLLSYPAGQMP